MKNTTRINNNIRAPEVRVIGAKGANLGVMKTADAVKQALEEGLDLIEISPNATPPVARITDFGKFQYEQKKKQRDIKAKAHTTETKNVQIKVGTGDHDLNLEASRVSEWLKEGHRVKIDLFLRGRYKYMDEKFLKERIDRFLALVPDTFKVADPTKKSPKGFSIIIERDKDRHENQ